jgi:hypothetical protein
MWNKKRTGLTHGAATKRQIDTTTKQRHTFYFLKADVWGHTFHITFVAGAPARLRPGHKPYALSEPLRPLSRPG